MKKSTKIGWVLITAALVMAVWVFTSHSSEADQTTDAGFVLNDAGTRLLSYQGSGGSITIPSGVTAIADGVFANNSSITSVTMPNSVTALGSRVFSGATNLRSVTLGQVTGIPASTFQNCMSLTSVTIPSTVTSIGSQAFYGCAALGSISIPGGVSSINTDAFGECNNLTSISAGNSFYSSYDGCLYNASGSRLLVVPPGKSSISFSASVRTIGADSFSYNRNISSVTLPNSVDAIESGAFANSDVSSITVPKSVVSIGSQGSWKPSEMYGYQGSAAQTYANSNNITFIALDAGRGSSSDTANGESTTDSDDNDDSDPDIINNDDPDGPEDDYIDDGGGDDDDSPSDYNRRPNRRRNSRRSASGDASGNAIIPRGNGGNYNAGGRGYSYNGKDVTPKTADINIDIRYVFCAIVLLLGIFIMIWGNKRKYTIVRKNASEA